MGLQTLEAFLTYTSNGNLSETERVHCDPILCRLLYTYLDCIGLFVSHGSNKRTPSSHTNATQNTLLQGL